MTLDEVLDSQEFHELCMDYRGAPAWALFEPSGPQACFERLQHFLRRELRAPQAPTVSEQPPPDVAGA